MSRVTLQVLEGLERGQVFADLDTPVSIGREDDNSVRLNDERVSRFHAKIQEDGSHIILTDLDSTNGTRVNGHPIQMHVLQYGDQVLIGRCLMVFGSQEDILEKAMQEPPRQTPATSDGAPGSSDRSGGRQQRDQTYFSTDPNEVWGNGDSAFDLLFPKGPPAVPEQLSPGQRAEVSDMMAYVHDRIRVLLESGQATEGDPESLLPVMKLNWKCWQSLLALEMDLAKYLRTLADPNN